MGHQLLRPVGVSPSLGLSCLSGSCYPRINDCSQAILPSPAALAAADSGDAAFVLLVAVLLILLLVVLPMLQCGVGESSRKGHPQGVERFSSRQTVSSLLVRRSFGFCSCLSFIHSLNVLRYPAITAVDTRETTEMDAALSTFLMRFPRACYCSVHTLRKGNM